MQAAAYKLPEKDLSPAPAARFFGYFSRIGAEARREEFGDKK